MVYSILKRESLSIKQFTFTVVVFLRKLILADSIARDVGELPGVVMHVKRGGYLEHFTADIVSGSITVTGMDAILIHVGTNNICRDFDPQAVLCEMGNLLKVIRRLNNKVHLVVSGILPRLVDLHETENIVKHYNKLLVNVCRDTNTMLIRSFNSFVSGNEPTGVKTWLYARDGLHLSVRGSQVLTQMFRVQFADRNIAQRRVVLDAERDQRSVRDFNFGFTNRISDD